VDDTVLTLEDAREVVKKIESPVEVEIIWARRTDANDEALPGTALLGYESNTFYPPTCDSPIAEGMFFTYPGSYDDGGSRFKCIRRSSTPGVCSMPHQTPRSISRTGCPFCHRVATSIAISIALQRSAG
jgi:hypothetical protein